MIDSVGSSSDGVAEKEGKATTGMLKTLFDLVRRGIVILVLRNATKDGAGRSQRKLHLGNIRR